VIPTVGTSAGPAGADTGLHVAIVGVFGVRRLGQSIPNQVVGSRKARLLLALLAVRRRLTGVETIAEALWEVAPPQVTQNIATLVSRLRGVLGWHAVIGGRAGYRLGDGVWVDLYHAVNRVEASARLLRAGDDPAALATVEHALQVLHVGGVLDDMPGAEWAEPARLLHVASLRRARHIAAEAALRTANAEMAQQVAAAALHADPFDETACRLAMRAHVAAAEPARAVAEYELLRARLADELGIDPAAETRELHVALLRGTAAGAAR
jgi:DNA-binding SARP family transcriptional activator